MSSLILFFVSVGAAAFITTLAITLHSEYKARKTAREMSSRVERKPLVSAPEGDEKISQHMREKSRRRNQELAEWDRQFKALEPPPPPPVPTGYETIVVKSANGDVVQTFREPTYY